MFAVERVGRSENIPEGSSEEFEHEQQSRTIYETDEENEEHETVPTSTCYQVVRLSEWRKPTKVSRDFCTELPRGKQWFWENFLRPPRKLPPISRKFNKKQTNKNDRK